MEEFGIPDWDFEQWAPDPEPQRFERFRVRRENRRKDPPYRSCRMEKDYMVKQQDDGLFTIVEISYIYDDRNRLGFRKFRDVATGMREQDAESKARELNGFAERKRRKEGQILLRERV